MGKLTLWGSLQYLNTPVLINHLCIFRVPSSSISRCQRRNVRVLRNKVAIFLVSHPNNRRLSPNRQRRDNHMQSSILITAQIKMPVISFSNNRRTSQCFNDTPRILGSSNIEMILMTATQVLCTKLNRPAFIRFMFGFFRITVRNIQMHGNAIRPQNNRIGLQQPNY